MNRVIIYINANPAEDYAGAADQLLKRYCMNNGYDVVGSFAEDSRKEGITFPMQLAFVGAAYDSGVDGVVTLIPQMLSFKEDEVVEVLQRLDEHGIEVETLAGDIESYYDKMYQPKEECSECSTREECELLRNVINKFLCED